MGVVSRELSVVVIVTSPLLSTRLTVIAIKAVGICLDGMCFDRERLHHRTLEVIQARQLPGLEIPDVLALMRLHVGGLSLRRNSRFAPYGLSARIANEYRTRSTHTATESVKVRPKGKCGACTTNRYRKQVRKPTIATSESAIRTTGSRVERTANTMKRSIPAARTKSARAARRS